VPTSPGGIVYGIALWLAQDQSIVNRLWSVQPAPAVPIADPAGMKVWASGVGRQGDTEMPWVSVNAPSLGHSMDSAGGYFVEPNVLVRVFDAGFDSCRVLALDINRWLLQAKDQIYVGDYGCSLRPAGTINWLSSPATMAPRAGEVHEFQLPYRATFGEVIPR
jgi:hypothetical protein